MATVRRARVPAPLPVPAPRVLEVSSKVLEQIQVSGAPSSPSVPQVSALQNMVSLLGIFVTPLSPKEGMKLALIGQGDIGPESTVRTLDLAACKRLGDLTYLSPIDKKQKIQALLASLKTNGEPWSSVAKKARELSMNQGLPLTAFTAVTLEALNVSLLFKRDKDGEMSVLILRAQKDNAEHLFAGVWMSAEALFSRLARAR
jgi:hypothetical protein